MVSLRWELSLQKGTNQLFSREGFSKGKSDVMNYKKVVSHWH